MSTTSVPTTLTGTYAIDPTHSRIGFVARHAMVTKVRGSFNEFEGSGHFDAEDPTRSKVELTIQAASIDTRNADRDGHLRSNDFFDMERHPEITFSSTAVEQLDAENYRVTGDLTIKTASIDTRNADRDAHLRGNDFFDMENHPEITFASTAIESLDDDHFKVTGDLTIKGVTKPVSVDFEYAGTAVDPFGNHRIGLEGKTTVNRKDWGVNWNAALEAGGVLVSEKVTLEFDVSAIRSDG